MRLKSSVISFVLTLAIGVSLAQVSSAVDWLWPSFNREEAAAQLGHRVRYRHTEKFRGMKCPEEGFCKEVQKEEYGTIIGIEEVPDGGYFLVVRWDEASQAESYLSYCGRYVHRQSLLQE